MKHCVAGRYDRTSPGECCLEMPHLSGGGESRIRQRGKLTHNTVAAEFSDDAVGSCGVGMPFSVAVN